MPGQAAPADPGVPRPKEVWGQRSLLWKMGIMVAIAMIIRLMWVLTLHEELLADKRFGVLTHFDLSTTL